MKKSKQYYTLQNAAGADVSIDLNNYKVICNNTNQRKGFHHKYLFNLIHRKYQGNIDLFRTTYVSRAGVDRDAQQVKKLNDRIDRLRAQIDTLVSKRDQLTS